MTPVNEAAEAKGLIAWWGRLTAPPIESINLRDPAERERFRRAQLASAVIPVILLFAVILTPIAFANTSSFLGWLALLIACLVSLFLNRSGATTITGVLLVLAVMAATTTAVTSVPDGLELIWLPAFHLLTIAIVVAGLLLPRWAAFVTAGVTSALLVIVVHFGRHAPDLTKWIADNASGGGESALFPRVFAEFWVVATLVFLLSRSIERAIARADRAEDLARAEAQLAEQARYIADQNARLEFGIQQLLETHRRLAVGDFSVRTPTQQDNELWQIAISLNNLINRFARMATTEQRLQGTEEALSRIAAQIDTARQGGTPMWPAPSGTAADQILRALGVAMPPGWNAPRMMGPPSQPQRPMPPSYTEGYGGHNQSSAPRQEAPWSDPWRPEPHE